MADESPLGGLLDRASDVFSLAGKLGREFHEERLSERGPINRDGWQRHAPDFDKFCSALLELREEIQNPPDGFAAVAVPLLEAARIAKGIRDAMQRPDGRSRAAYRDFFPDLNSVAENGWRAVQSTSKAERLDDPFAFVDEPAAKDSVGIDTTPMTPKPATDLITAADRDIPEILANVPPSPDGTIELVAVQLTKRLQDAGHTLASAEWAVHSAIVAGRLRSGLIEMDTPSFGRSVGGAMRYVGGSDDRRMEWSGGERCTVAIPQGKPAPFACFKVTATESLWDWWRALAAISSSPDAGESRREPEAFGTFSAAALAAVDGGSYTSNWENPKNSASPLLPVTPPGRTSAETNHAGGPVVPLPPTMTADGGGTPRPKRGRRKADYETIQREAKMAAEWNQARDAGVYKGDFAKDRGTTISDLDNLLDRVRARNRASE